MTNSNTPGVHFYSPKKCVECGVAFLPTSGVQKYCPAHGKGAWDRAHPERSAEIQRRSQRRYRHKREWGDPDIYDRMVVEHGDVCGICGVGPAPGHHLALDHDHATGVPRGLLCPVHNTGLGYFQDDADTLQAAADYLRRSL